MSGDAYDRLRHYEQLLDKHGIPREGQSHSVSGTASPSNIPESEQQKTIDNPYRPDRFAVPLNPDARLVSENGNSRFVDSFFWRLSKQSDHAVFLWDKLQSENTLPGIIHRPIGVPFMLFGPGGIDRVHAPVVSYETSMQLWRVYIDRVEPIVKIIHQPTVYQVFKATALDSTKAMVPARCLTYAIHHLAIMSLSDSECRETMNGQPKDQALLQFRLALQQSLVDADLLRSTELHVLQAFVMLLFSVRGAYDAQVIWMLSGLSLRLAQSMGLHRDGELLGLSPFDTEIRRRIFWQIPQIDGFSSQLCGTGITIDVNTFDTKWPSNVNDDDIHPNMVDRPIARTGATDMMYWLCKAELVRLYLKTREWTFLLQRPGDAGYLRNLEAAEKTVDETEDAMESKYLRYCDPVDPVHILTLVTCRAAIQSQRFRMILPSAKEGLADEASRSKMTKTALRVIDYVTSMHSNPALSKFVWHTCVFFCWDVMIWTLHEIARTGANIDRELAWAKLGKLFTW